MATGKNSFISQHLQYLPFGDSWIDQQNGYDSRYTFSAKEKDDETQYSYFGARYYDSDLSVWLSVDPMADKYPSMSAYMYCAGNPVMLVDPDGNKIRPVGETANKAMIYLAKKYGQLLMIQMDNKTGVYSSTSFNSRADFEKSFKAGLKAKDCTYKKEDIDEAWAVYSALDNSDVFETSVIQAGTGSQTTGNNDGSGSTIGENILQTSNSEYDEFIDVLKIKGGSMTSEMSNFLFNKQPVKTGEGTANEKTHTIYPNQTGGIWAFFKNSYYISGQRDQTRGLIVINGTNQTVYKIANTILEAINKINSTE